MTFDFDRTQMRRLTTEEYMNLEQGAFIYTWAPGLTHSGLHGAILMVLYSPYLDKTRFVLMSGGTSRRGTTWTMEKGGAFATDATVEVYEFEPPLMLPL